MCSLKTLNFRRQEANQRNQVISICRSPLYVIQNQKIHKLISKDNATDEKLVYSLGFHSIATPENKNELLCIVSRSERL